ncbi:transposable element Tcb2 transposase [Trichonephila clavipes]|uniref:Transposable element Tcb2 transposase n=1 Tax=Trichonephila clavipes TaxID=2585209 RepID=A0A8X6RRK9_TRICX|nr:transposable element Tcb2 transposase [Trichonephila clavipes]
MQYISHQKRRKEATVLQKASWPSGVMWTKEASFTRRPGSGGLRQASRREDRHIIRHACAEATVSLAAIQKPVTLSLRAPVSSRTITRCRARRYWPAMKWNQVVFKDESRFNLSNDDNRVRVWRTRGECLNPAFALQRHTSPTASVIAYDTRSPPNIDPWHIGSPAARP